jgi:hypothetical protein
MSAERLAVGDLVRCARCGKWHPTEQPDSGSATDYAEQMLFIRSLLISPAGKCFAAILKSRSTAQGIDISWPRANVFDDSFGKLRVPKLHPTPPESRASRCRCS